MKLLTKNKKAYFDYEMVDEIEAGIVLTGSEVKSIKTQGVSLTDALIKISGKELVINMTIQLYDRAHKDVALRYTATKPRKLLVTKNQLTKLAAKTTKTGYILLPLEVFLTGRGRIKVKVGVGKILKKVDKREKLKEKDIKKDMQRDLKSIGY